MRYSREIVGISKEIQGRLLLPWSGSGKPTSEKTSQPLSGLLTNSSDLTFFGSDAAEVIKTRRDWEDLMRNDWQLFESTQFGEPRNLAIQISDDRKLASAVYEVQDVSIVDGKRVESLDRFAVTMRKERGAWRVVHGMTAVATRGQSSAEIVARRKLQAPQK